jgi:hypothetical protein
MTPFPISHSLTLCFLPQTDEFQARKCSDFKRMMVQSVPPGAVVGVPVPLGYDSVLVSCRRNLVQICQRMTFALFLNLFLHVLIPGH